MENDRNFPQNIYYWAEEEGTNADDIEFLREFGKLYEETLSLLSDGDFFVNAPQMERLCEVYGFFTKHADAVEPLELSPREQHGWVTAEFVAFGMYGETLKEFQKILGHVSALGIDALTNGKIRVSVTVPYVFIEK